MATTQIERLVSAAKEHNNCHSWNLWRQKNPNTPISLKECDLSGLDLTGANLQKAHLQKMKLNGANLQSCNLESAVILATELAKCDLEWASLKNAKLSDVNFASAAMRFADFNEADLQNVSFQSADLREANFYNTKIQQTNFSKADLSKSNFFSSKGVDLSFDEAVMNDGCFCHSKWKTSSFENTFLLGAQFYNSYVHSSKFSHAEMIGVGLENANWEDTTIDNSDLSEATLDRTRLANSHIQNTSLPKLSGLVSSPNMTNNQKQNKCSVLKDIQVNYLFFRYYLSGLRYWPFLLFIYSFFYAVGFHVFFFLITLGSVIWILWERHQLQKSIRSGKIVPSTVVRTDPLHIAVYYKKNNQRTIRVFIPPGTIANRKLDVGTPIAIILSADEKVIMPHLITLKRKKMEEITAKVPMEEWLELSEEIQRIPPPYQEADYPLNQNLDEIDHQLNCGYIYSTPIQNSFWLHRLLSRYNERIANLCWIFLPLFVLFSAKVHGFWSLGTTALISLVVSVSIFYFCHQLMRYYVYHLTKIKFQKQDKKVLYLIDEWLRNFSKDDAKLLHIYQAFDQYFDFQKESVKFWATDKQSTQVSLLFGKWLTKGKYIIKEVYEGEKILNREEWIKKIEFILKSMQKEFFQEFRHSLLKVSNVFPSNK